jgi:replication factor A1
VEVLESLGVEDKIGEPVALSNNTDEESKPTTISSNGFYGNQPVKKEPNTATSLPSRSNGGPRASAATHANLYPIESLSPWHTNKWTIKARCLNKSDIKTWHNKNGEGKLFSTTFMDDSGEIRATGFTEQCEQFFDIIQEGMVYYISSPCQVKTSNKKFSNVKHDYELTFERGTIIEKVSIASMPYLRTR